MGPFVVFLGTDKSGSIQLCPSVKMILFGFFFFIYFSSFSFSIWYLSFTLKIYLYVCLFVYTVSSDLSISKGWRTHDWSHGLPTVRQVFQSYDPVTPSILSSFLLHLSDALLSGRVLLRLSVRHPYADSPTAVQALKVDSHHGSHASPRYRCFVIWLFPFPECLFICDRFYPLLG